MTDACDRKDPQAGLEAFEAKQTHEVEAFEARQRRELQEFEQREREELEEFERRQGRAFTIKIDRLSMRCMSGSAPDFSSEDNFSKPPIGPDRDLLRLFQAAPIGRLRMIWK